MGKTLSATLYKLLGILAIFQAIRMLPSGLVWIAYDLPSDPTVNVLLAFAAWLVPFLVFLGGGLFLVLRGDRLGPRETSRDPESPGSGSGADIHSSLLSAAGVLLIGIAVAALPEATSEMILAYSVPEGMFGPLESPAKAWGSLISSLLQMAFGVLLVLKSTTLVRLLRRRWDRTRIEAVDAQCPHCGFWIVASDYRADAPAFRCDNCKHEIPNALIPAAQVSRHQTE